MQAEVDFSGRTKFQFSHIIRWLGNPATYLTGALWGAGALCCLTSHCQRSSHQLGLLICAIRFLSQGDYY